MKKMGRGEVGRERREGTSGGKMGGKVGRESWEGKSGGVEQKPGGEASLFNYQDGKMHSNLFPRIYSCVCF